MHNIGTIHRYDSRVPNIVLGKYPNKVLEIKLLNNLPSTIKSLDHDTNVCKKE
jgi:hypothetical protein